MIEMKNIHKSFGTNLVLEDVDLTLQEGEILGLLGENGAGKSTLMNILGGVLPSDKGTIILNGESVNFNKPSDSIDKGIAFIHQELNLVNDLPIYENMFLGNEIRQGLFGFDSKAMIEKTQEVFNNLDLEIDPKMNVEHLDTAYKQVIEIARALLMNARYIIMDEPTSSLTNHEITRIFEMMRQLKKQGVGIIFISHKLDEVMSVCDKVVVLRNGKMVMSQAIENTSTDEIAYQMVGHEVRTEVLSRDIQYGKVMLEVKNLTRSPDFSDINFSVREGEIIGITGLLGDGRRELFLTLFGDTPTYSGQILIDGKEVKIRSIQESIHHGIAYLPSNRKENGIIKDLSVLENGTVVSYQDFIDKYHTINAKRQLDAFNDQKEKLNVMMSDPKNLITTLSGGNQQKVVLMKWLLNQPKILILDNPTQGVDVGSKEEIYDIIFELAGLGVAIIMLSNEPNEILRTCDRALVMYHGTLAGEVKGDTFNEHDIMRFATGLNHKQSKEEISDGQHP